MRKQVSRRTEVLRDIPRLDVGHEKIEEVATTLIGEHALPENETTDAYHIAKNIRRIEGCRTQMPRHHYA